VVEVDRAEEEELILMAGMAVEVAPRMVLQPSEGEVAEEHVVPGWQKAAVVAEEEEHVVPN